MGDDIRSLILAAAAVVAAAGFVVGFGVGLLVGGL